MGDGWHLRVPRSVRRAAGRAGVAGKLAAFGLVLAVMLGGGWAVGRAAGPVRVAGAHGDATSGGGAAGDGGTAAHDDTAPGGDTAPGDTAPGDTAAGGAAAGGNTAAGGGAAGGGAGLPGLATVQNGYALEAGTAELAAGTSGSYRFRIMDGSGAVVTRFAVEHDKRLHLVVVRRDGAHYRHVHPELATDGTWSVPLTPPAAGVYRVFADFRPEGGPKTTLAADLHVPGPYQPVAAAGEARTTDVEDYQVRLDGELAAGVTSTVHAVITRAGRPVTDLQPYLGAYGHLVALRAGDLAYLHVHPEESPTAGPEVTFAVQAPSAGRYLLYLDFQHGGRVHTAAFVVAARPGTAARTHGDNSHGHGG